MTREDLADALAGADFVLQHLGPLVLAEKQLAGLTWDQVAAETGLPRVTVYQLANDKREAQTHTIVRVVSWLHCRTRPDPTHGRIDRDIQAYVNGMQPTDVGRRTAMENTIQAKRDRGERLAVDR